MLLKRLKEIPRNIRYFFYNIHYKFNRFVIAHPAAMETWCLYSEIGDYLIPRLKQLRETVHGYPIGLSDQKWQRVLLKIQELFEYIREDSFDRYHELYGDKLDVKLYQSFAKKYENKKKIALRLLEYFYFNLWD